MEKPTNANLPDATAHCEGEIAAASVAPDTNLRRTPATTKSSCKVKCIFYTHSGARRSSRADPAYSSEAVAAIGRLMNVSLRERVR